MARAISNHRVLAFQTSIAPGTEVDAVTYWQPPKGMNTTAKLSQVPNEYSPLIVNLMLDQGYMRSRYGSLALGAADNRVQAILSFTPADGAGSLLRVRTDGVDSWNGSTWLPVVDIVLTGNVTDRFTWTGWGNELLLCNGADKIISYNVLTGEVKVLTESFPARHITSFNGRVVASATTEGAFFGYRIRWSVKNDNTDWTAQTTTDAIGAGYEDLLATPGGFVDEVMGTYPLSDETSLVLRENSLWLMFVTGNVDAPFRFSRLTSEVGSRARHSAVLTPFGVVFVSHEDVMLVDQSGPQSLGTAIRRSLFNEITDFPALTGSYDPRRQEYRLANDQKVWRYSWRDQGWTTDEYTTGIRHHSFVDWKSLGLTFDQLTGTFDELTGTFDELGIDAVKEGMHRVDESGVELREDQDTLTDNDQPAPIEIQTALLQSGSPLEKTGIIEAQVEYECDVAQRLIFDYSTDKAATWTQYSYADIVPTTGPKILRVQKTLESHNLQVRVRSESLGKLSLISLNLFLVKGARVNQ